MGYYRTPAAAAAAAAAVGAADGYVEPPTGSRGGRGGKGRGGRGGRGRKAAAAVATGDAGEDENAAADDDAAAAAADDSDGGVWGPFDDSAEVEDDLDLAAVQGSADVAEPAVDVLLPLLPFQKQFLAWGIKQVCTLFPCARFGLFSLSLRGCGGCGITHLCWGK
jgi:hypothetical protein